MFQPIFYPSNVEELLDKVSEEEIYNHYFGDFINDVFYPSPFRYEEDPSFKINYYDGRWVWRDFGEDIRPSDAISFVMKKYNIKFNDAINLIYEELVLGVENKLPIFSQDKKVISRKKSCRFWELDRAELKYWEKRSIGKEACNYYDIHGGTCFLDNKLVLSGYIYMFSRERKIYKGYDPKSKLLKFFGSNISNHIQNYEELSNTHNFWGKKYNTDVLIIQKANKEAIETNYLGFHSIAPHTESMFIPPWEIDYLRTIFPHIYVFYDNDDTGIKKCTEFTKVNKLGYINVPNKYKPLKDGDDIVVNHGYNLLEDIIHEKLQRDGVKIIF